MALAKKNINRLYVMYTNLFIHKIIGINKDVIKKNLTYRRPLGVLTCFDIFTNTIMDHHSMQLLSMSWDAELNKTLAVWQFC